LDQLSNGRENEGMNSTLVATRAVVVALAITGLMAQPLHALLLCCCTSPEAAGSCCQQQVEQPSCCARPSGDDATSGDCRPAASNCADHASDSHQCPCAVKRQADAAVLPADSVPPTPEVVVDRLAFTAAPSLAAATAAVPDSIFP